MTKYMLVSFKTCPWVQRSAIILREKNTPFELRHIEPDNRPDWFLAISPHKKVPVLRLDDRVSLFESNAIAEYLDETIAPRLHRGAPECLIETHRRARVALNETIGKVPHERAAKQRGAEGVVVAREKRFKSAPRRK